MVLFLLILAAGTGLAESSKLAEAELIVPAAELPPILTEGYRINVGDVLGVDFYKTTDFSQDVTVGPDGAVHLPLVGRVSVVGRTVDDVRSELMEGYGREMVNPQITVSVREFSGLSVYVMGEVFDPGALDYRGGMTLIQAISEAGGFNIKARRKEVLLIRPGPDFEPVGTLIDVRKILRGGQFENDIPLAPLDIVYVHHKEIVNVNNFVELYISRNLPRFGPWIWYLPGYGQ